MGRFMTHKFDARNAEILDSQDRMKFLNTDMILDKIGLEGEMVLADLGCGTGYFSLSNKIYRLFICFFELFFNRSINRASF